MAGREVYSTHMVTSDQKLPSTSRERKAKEVPRKGSITITIRLCTDVIAISGGHGGSSGHGKRRVPYLDTPELFRTRFASSNASSSRDTAAR